MQTERLKCLVLKPLHRTRKKKKELMTPIGPIRMRPMHSTPSAQKELGGGQVAVRRTAPTFYRIFILSAAALRNALCHRGTSVKYRKRFLLGAVLLVERIAEDKSAHLLKGDL